MNKKRLEKRKKRIKNLSIINKIQNIFDLKNPDVNIF
jgi:hypothetical protein